MSEKRFTIKSTATELELYDNGVKIGEFPHYEWVARPVDYVVKTLNEQQATIEQLQDLCGQSDGENAKLRIENKRLCDELKLLKPTNIEQYEQIVQLQEENEQLKQEVFVYKKAFQEQVQRCTL